MAITVTCKKITDVQVIGVTLNELSLTLEIDDTATLIATVFPENATNQSVVFTSSNPLVASITSNGLVTALSKGVTSIEVTTVDGNFSVKCTIHVDECFVIEAIDILDSSNDIYTAYAIVFGKDDEKILASTKYQNNSFKLQLPSIIDDKYLWLLFDYPLFSDIFGDLDESWISDRNANITFVWPDAWDEDKNDIGFFIYMYHSYYLENSYAQGFFLYADRDFTVKGEKIDEDGVPYECDCSFSKGWNFLCLYRDINYHTPHTVNYYLLTTKKPSEGIGIWNWEYRKWPEWKKSSNKTKARNLFVMTWK